MSSLAVACLVHLALALPVVAGGAWCWHRYSAPLLLDTLDADETVVGAVHRLGTLTYTLLAVGFVAWQAPEQRDVVDGIAPAVLGSWARVVFTLGLTHAVLLWVFLSRRRQRERALLAPPPMPTPPPPFRSSHLAHLPPPVYTAPPGTFTPPVNGWAPPASGRSGPVPLRWETLAPPVGRDYRACRRR